MERPRIRRHRLLLALLLTSAAGVRSQAQSRNASLDEARALAPSAELVRVDSPAVNDVQKDVDGALSTGGLETVILDRDPAGYTEKDCFGFAQGESNVRCFYTPDGVLHHWIYDAYYQNPIEFDTHQYYLYLKRHDYKSPPHWISDFYSGFALVREEQRRYNEWVAKRPCALDVYSLRSYSQEGAGLPAEILDSGTLNIRTLKIPYYRGLCELDAMRADLLRDRQQASSSDGDAALVDRARAIAAAQDALGQEARVVEALRPKTRAVAYKRFGYRTDEVEGDHLEPEAVPPGLTADLRSAHAAVAAALTRVRDARREYLSRPVGTER